MNEEELWNLFDDIKKEEHIDNGINNLLGCFFILCGVLLSQLLPLVKKIN